MKAAPILLATSLPAEEEEVWLDLLAALLPDETLVTPGDCGDRAGIEIAIVANPPGGALYGLPGLRFIHSLWAGVEGLLRDESVPQVPLARLVDPALARTMAEAVAAAVMHLHRDFHHYAAQQHRREWRPRPALLAAERHVTILGLGEMGRAAAVLLQRLGFPMRGWSRSGTTLEGIATFAGVEGFMPAIEGADILVNLLPLTPATQGILSAATFAHLARGASLVNFGRGGHLVEADLVAALQSGRLSHAMLDVFDTEPLPRAHPFWTLPGVTVLPHVAAPTTKVTAAAIVAAAVKAFRATGTLPRAVDRQRGY